MKELLTSEKVGKLDKKIIDLSFEDFCNGDSKLVNDIINRWTSIGLLGGLDEQTAKECACYYERMAVYLIYEKELSEADEEFETVVFPMIRRVLTSVGTLNGVFEPNGFEKFYYNNIDEAKGNARDYWNNCKKEPKTEFDEEACTLAWLCDKYVEKIKKQ